jgi:hypothetical protein
MLCYITFVHSSPFILASHGSFHCYICTILFSLSCSFFLVSHRCGLFLSVTFMRFAVLIVIYTIIVVSKLLMWYYCLCFVVIEMKSVTLAFDRLGGGGDACDILTVLFAFQCHARPRVMFLLAAVFPTRVFFHLKSVWTLWF